jgi:hypothetical protein
LKRILSKRKKEKKNHKQKFRFGEDNENVWYWRIFKEVDNLKNESEKEALDLDVYILETKSEENWTKTMHEWNLVMERYSMNIKASIRK